MPWCSSFLVSMIRNFRATDATEHEASVTQRHKIMEKDALQHASRYKPNSDDEFDCRKRMFSSIIWIFRRLMTEVDSLPDAYSGTQCDSSMQTRITLPKSEC